jgi:hypothetical protein
VTFYRRAWRAKMDEVNACIAANAEQEELVDQPEVVKGVVRVSGPFTVEGVQPPELSLGEVLGTVGGFGGEPKEVGPTCEVREARLGESPENVEAYLDRMVRLLRADGVRFPDNKQMRFTRLEAIYASGQAGGFHAEGRWVPEGETDPEPEGPATVGVVFGQPRTRLEGPDNGEYRVVMEGVDIYNPVDNSVTPTRADKVAAWFLDGAYDGRAFCITQAFFPDPSAWEKLSKALTGVVDPERFAAFGQTRSLPFKAGKHRRAAVKVIDPRGNEVMRVHQLDS